MPFTAVGAYMAVNVPAEAAYTYTSILVNDSVEKVDRGKVNGIGQSLASATRMVGVHSGLDCGHCLKMDLVSAFIHNAWGEGLSVWDRG